MRNAVIPVMMGRGILVVALAGGLLGCPSEKAPPKTGQTEQAAATPPDKAGSQPGSAPSQPRPQDHPTSSTAVTLETLFRLPDGPDVIATVNDRPIHKKAMEGVLRQMQIQLGATGSPVRLDRLRVLNGAMEQLVEQTLRHELAAQLGVEADPQVAAKWLEDLEKRMAVDEKFAMFLLRAGKDADQRKIDSMEQALMFAVSSKLRDQSKDALEVEAKKYYDKNKKQFFQHAGRETWRLFIKAPRGMVQRDRDIAKTRADDLHKRAKKKPNGKAFENLVKSHSEGGKRTEGGYIGWVAKGTFAKGLEDQIFKAKPNSILPLYEDAHGYYIYLIGKSRPERQHPFEEVKEQIFAQVFRTVLDKEMNTRLDALRAKQKVEIHIPELIALRKERREVLKSREAAKKP